MKLPESFGNVVGELPVGGRLPDGQEFPSGTLRPVRDGFVERNDVKSPYAATYLARRTAACRLLPFERGDPVACRTARHARNEGRHPLNRCRRPPPDHGRCHFFVRSVDGRDFSARL